MDCSLPVRFDLLSISKHMNKLTHISGAILVNLPPPRRVLPTFPNMGSRVERKLSPKHYGIACSPVFDPTKHEEARKYWDIYEGQWRCEAVNWVVKKVYLKPWQKWKHLLI
jgi:hypothetical protein